MGNDANDIEQIAPTPWKPDPDYRGHFLDAKGDMVSRWAVRDRIIACVNFCAEMPTQELEKLTRHGAVCRILRACIGELKENPELKLPPNIGFAEAAAVVRNHRPE